MGRDWKSQKRKKGQLSRKDHANESKNRRSRVDDSKRRRVELGDTGPAIWQDTFTEEEIKDEPRRKKQKVAIIFGYAGTGYHGLQIDRKQETVEGDLFRACVRAGAISKANSDDPKKLAWVRCSRTDRNVHAAANVISAQMIVEDEDIVERVNGHLPPQVRVWGMEKLNKTFNAHQRCEGRVYQYWIPTFCFVPPHPRSFLGIQLAELAKENERIEEYEERQREVADFWTKAEEEFIAPVLKRFDAETCAEALHAIFDPHLKPTRDADADTSEKTNGAEPGATVEPPEPNNPKSTDLSPVGDAIKAFKDAYKAARHSYRINETRKARVTACLGEFQGTQNYWNYTPNKSAHEASAKRFIPTTSVGQAVEVRGVEWVPLDIHGQSFMLNQIRKMAFMTAMCVRCGSVPSLIRETFEPTVRFMVPKAPPTGLLLERPIFDVFNAHLDNMQDPSQRSRIDFEKFRPQIDAFKRTHIIEPMHTLEEQHNIYYNFFMSLDSLRSNQLLYFSAGGTKATDRKIEGQEGLDELLAENEDEGEAQGDDD